MTKTRSEEDKAALANWRERTPNAEAITPAAASRGSKMHAYLESFILNRENLSFFDDGEQHKLMAKQIIEKGLINRLEEVWGWRQLFFILRYSGGYSDCGSMMEKKATIVDFKQSNKPKKAEYIDSWFLQTAAYSLAHNIVYNSNINAV